MKELAEDLKVEKNPDQKKIVLKFGGEQGSENLDFYVTLFSNGNTNTSVTSSQRATISYQGHVSGYSRKRTIAKGISPARNLPPEPDYF